MNNVINFAGGGIGDMKKSVYDPTNSGSVSKATGDSEGRNIKQTYQEQIQNLSVSDALSDTDTLPFYSTENSSHNKITWANIKAKIKAYCDTLYALASHTHSIGDVSGLSDALNKTDVLSVTDDGDNNITISISKV